MILIPGGQKGDLCRCFMARGRGGRSREPPGRLWLAGGQMALPSGGMACREPHGMTEHLLCTHLCASCHTYQPSPGPGPAAAHFVNGGNQDWKADLEEGQRQDGSLGLCEMPGCDS